MSTIGIPLADDRREAAAVELQALLTDLIDLSLQAKQAHWNVVGRHFTPLHEQLDVLVNESRDWIDALAERVVTVGRAPDGSARTVATASRLDAYPDGFVPDDKTVALLVARIADVIEATRGSLDHVGQADLVSQDLVIEILRGLEKHLWMFQAQTS